MSAAILGPPRPLGAWAQAGTGKTTVIAAYVGILNRVFSEYTRRNARHIIFVTTEKNAAINDVVEALFKQHSSTADGQAMLNSALSFGSAVMGSFTKMLSLESRVEAHPNVKALSEQIAMLERHLADPRRSSFQDGFSKLGKREKDMFKRFITNKSIHAEVQAAIAAAKQKQCDPQDLSGRWALRTALEIPQGAMNIIKKHTSGVR